MPTVVGLTFEPAGTIHYYTPAQLPLIVGDYAVADTPAGLRVGQVIIAPRAIAQEDLPTAVRPVVRLANDDDIARNASNERLESRAREVVPEKIEQLGLPMKMIDIDADWDGTRITVYFAAEGRVDFRELVRVLAGALGVRVQMHQLGARDHAKMIGGLASCGRELCCSAWMNAFEPVSMRMAKEQSLFLNPSKFSGNCGKLKCCLRYEYEFYSETDDSTPVPGEEYVTPEGTGHVLEVDAARSVALVDVPGCGTVEVKLHVRVDARAADTEVAPTDGC